MFGNDINIAKNLMIFATFGQLQKFGFQNESGTA